MFDDGRGILISDSLGVFVTEDAWETSRAVTPPGVSSDTRFIPREVDTSGNGLLYVVGYLVRSGVFRSAKTYVMRSADRGANWQECGPRLSGRYQSVSFNGSVEGVVLHEYFTHVPDQWDTVAITMRRVNTNMVASRIDTVDALREFSYVCNEFSEHKPSRVLKIDERTTLISRIHPCYRSLDGHTETTAFLLKQTLPDPLFIQVDATRNQAEAFRSFVRPAKLKVRLQNVWTGVHDRSSADSGRTWDYLYCRYFLDDDPLIRPFTSDYITNASDGSTHVLGVMPAKIPGKLELSAGPTSLDDCDVQWYDLPPLSFTGRLISLL